MSGISVGQISTNSSGAERMDIRISVIHWEKVKIPIVNRSHASQLSGISTGVSEWRTGKSGCQSPFRSFRRDWQGASLKAVEVSWKRRSMHRFPGWRMEAVLELNGELWADAVFVKDLRRELGYERLKCSCAKSLQVLNDRMIWNELEHDS